MSNLKLVDERKPERRKITLHLSADAVEVLEELAAKEECALEAYITQFLMMEALAYRVRRRS